MKRTKLTKIGWATMAGVTALALGASLATTPTQPAAALTTTQADNAYQAFVSQYWDASKKYFYTYSDHAVHSEHAVGPDGGLYTDYWWEAQLWEMVMDRYQRTHDTASRAMIDNIFDGFQAAYPTPTDNDWNDDIGWWARGSIRAYELTGESRFLAEAQTLFGFISTYEDTTYGGGIWWKNVDVGDGSRNEKNVATNGTAIYTALRLYAATGTQSYLTTATRLFTWLDSNFNRSGHLRDHVSGNGTFTDYDWTYNQGDYAGAALQMYLVANNQTYLSKATGAVDWAIANLTDSGTFRNEGIDDTAGFKAILTRNIRDLIDKAGQTQYEGVLTANASQAVNHVNASGIGANDWTAPAPSLTTTAVQSLAAAATAAIAQQAIPDGSTAIVQGSGIYEAENVDQSGVGNESSNAGYSGRGYVAGWITDGSFVTFHLNVATAGTHTLTLRYATGAGAATRAITVGGTPAGNTSFPSTGSWTTWSEVTVPVTLTAGSNAVSILFETATGSSNYLNLDRLTVSL